MSVNDEESLSDGLQRDVGSAENVGSDIKDLGHRAGSDLKGHKDRLSRLGGGRNGSPSAPGPDTTGVNAAFPGGSSENEDYSSSMPGAMQETGNISPTAPSDGSDSSASSPLNGSSDKAQNGGNALGKNGQNVKAGMPGNTAPGQSAGTPGGESRNSSAAGSGQGAGGRQNNGGPGQNKPGNGAKGAGRDKNVIGQNGQGEGFPSIGDMAGSGGGIKGGQKGKGSASGEPEGAAGGGLADISSKLKGTAKSAAKKGGDSVKKATKAVVGLSLSWVLPMILVIGIIFCGVMMPVAYYASKIFTNETSTVMSESETGTQNMYFNVTDKMKQDAQKAVNNPEYTSGVSVEDALACFEDVKDYPDFLSRIGSLVQLYLNDDYEQACDDFPIHVADGVARLHDFPPHYIDPGITWSNFEANGVPFQNVDMAGMVAMIIERFPNLKVDNGQAGDDFGDLLLFLASCEIYHKGELERNQPDDTQFLWVEYIYSEDFKVWVENWVLNEATGQMEDHGYWVWYAEVQFHPYQETPDGWLKLAGLNADDLYAQSTDYSFTAEADRDTNLKHFNKLYGLVEPAIGSISSFSLVGIHGGSLSEEDIQNYLDQAGDISKNRKQIIKTALSLVGAVWYEYGGGHGTYTLKPGWNEKWEQKKPNSDAYYGLDCSGFVRWAAWTALGTDSMNCAVSDEANHVERIISASELQPGDIGWIYGGGSHHVGIYLGGSTWIEAPQTGQMISLKTKKNGKTGSFKSFGVIPGADGDDKWTDDIQTHSVDSGDAAYNLAKALRNESPLDDGYAAVCEATCNMVQVDRNDFTTPLTAEQVTGYLTVHPKFSSSYNALILHGQKAKTGEPTSANLETLNKALSGSRSVFKDHVVTNWYAQSMKKSSLQPGTDIPIGWGTASEYVYVGTHGGNRFYYQKRYDARTSK